MSKERKICQCEKPDYDFRDIDSWRFVHCKRCDGFRLMTDFFNYVLAKLEDLEKAVMMTR